MKKLLPFLLILHAAGFVGAAVAQVAGYLPFEVLTPAGVTGAIIVAAVLALACIDYGRKPSFRVRRTAESIDVPDPRPVVPRPDWTYATRS